MSEKQQPFVVGIGGFKRTGKDTFARVVADVAKSRGFAVATIAFADPLRRAAAAAAAYGVDVSIFTDDARKETVCPAWGITYRQMLINLGEAMRMVDPDHWVKAWRQAVGRVLVQRKGCGHGEYEMPEHFAVCTVPPRPTLILVTDLRRVNEAAAIHDAGGVTVLMRRPGVAWDGHVNELPAHLAQHRDDDRAATLGCWYDSEGALSYVGTETVHRAFFDWTVDNDEAPDALLPYARALLDGLKG